MVPKNNLVPLNKITKSSWQIFAFFVSKEEGTNNPGAQASKHRDPFGLAQPTRERNFHLGENCRFWNQRGFIISGIFIIGNFGITLRL